MLPEVLLLAKTLNIPWRQFLNCLRNGLLLNPSELDLTLTDYTSPNTRASEHGSNFP
jgi:hypothetical protein